tara:strand:- start:694 stop:1362 length:669 start_codon:yes stop_codon:yes gene_type:complete
MRAFVITIEDLPASVVAANRCIESFRRTNPAIQIKRWKATTPKDDIVKMFTAKGIDPRYFNEQGGSYTKNCMSAFMSHFRLWEHSVIMNEEIIILEHDAVAVGHIPLDMRYKGCVNLGKPSYGKWEQPKSIGLNPLTSKQYFPGAHAYRLKPEAARTLIHTATEGKLAGPTDVFLNLEWFPFLEEYYPWPVEARDNFTTIQRDVGCRAKHNWSNEYAILQVR